jgi:hypothetical protein
MRFLFLVSFLIFSVSATAQSRFTLNGYIRDSATGESVIGATITVNGQQKSTISNQYGFYSITLDSGAYDISIAHVSYLVQMARVELTQNTSAVFQLVSKRRP